MTELKSSLQYKGFYFKENEDDRSKTDLFATRTLMFPSFKASEIDEHIKSNFYTLYDEGAVTFYMPYYLKDDRRNIYCDLSPLLLGTFDVPMPSRLFLNGECATKLEASKGLTDYELGIDYTRYFSHKKLIMIEEMYPVITHYFEIAFDVSSYEEMRDSILEHYRSYLLLGITSLTKTEDTSNFSPSLGYRSDMIAKDEYVPTKELA
jgi:hypothetical protein